MKDDRPNDYLFELLFTVFIMAALAFIAVDSMDIRNRSREVMSATDEAKSELVIIQSVIEKSEAAQIEYERRLRELAATMQPNPFQRSK